MKTRCKLKPGQKGTKGLLEKYGDTLVCVRYRYDETTRTRLKTVELIVDRKELPAPQRDKVSGNRQVPLKLSNRNQQLKETAKKLGGRWDPEAKLWYVSKAKVTGTELEKFIVLESGKKGIK